MSMRQMAKARRGAAVAVAAVLALALAGCGGDDENPKAAQSPTASSPQGGASQTPVPGPSQSSVPLEVLATVDGEDGVLLTINSAKRDAGGFLTVSGQIKNTAKQQYVKTGAWRGTEKALAGSGESMGGATLVDKAGKKRYYVLRDTEGRCLCTSGVASLQAEQTIPFFAQFPAPPTSSSEVEFSLPTFATATVKISG